jgi:hypothetical protein
MRLCRALASSPLLLIFGCLLVSPAFADWKADLDRALNMPAGEEQDRLITAVVRAEPDFEEVVERIKGASFPAAETDDLLLDSALCTDGVERPWVLYVPPGYNPGEPSPILVRLHGGVGRADIVEEPLAYAEEDEWLAVAKEHGWLVLYPFGQDGATWWDRVGMANIRNLIRTVKRRYNVDDDRVWMAGFSDGASGGFAWAMVEPNDLAAVVTLNGHIGVGSLDGDLPLYAVNLANTPVYAVTTAEDELYPSDVMRPTIEMALDAGADLIYRELAGRHEFTYAEEELPRIAEFLLRHPRDPFPAEIVWEAGVPDYGGCRWLTLDRITTADPEPWHSDFNCALVNDRITIGFISDDKFEGEGVKVGRVLEDTAAEDMGLSGGDVIIRGNGMAIADMDDLVEFKADLERGDPFQLTVERGPGTMVLDGRIHPPENYYVFKREMPSGLVNARYLANRVDLLSSRVGAVSILVHPDMVNLEEPLRITWNGQVVYEKKVKPDLAYLIRNFLEERDRNLLYVARISLDYPG